MLGGVFVKTVYAETQEQMDKIHYLVDYFYTKIFPDYFTDDQIHEFYTMNFLNILQKNDRDGTLPESFQIITSLETIIFTIEANVLASEKYQHLFMKNAERLTRLGFDFPFSYESFLEKNSHWLNELSEFRKGQNQWLV